MSLDFDGCFDRFHTSAFRLETLQQYDVAEDDAVLLAWRSGRARPEYSVRTSPWAARLACTSIAGKQWRRVRAVDFPLSEYVRWEMAAYAESAVLGEEIRIVERLGRWTGLSSEFWLFDADGAEPYGVEMVYDEHGRQGAHRLVTDPDTLDGWRELAAATWDAAVPLNQFVASAREHLA